MNSLHLGWQYSHGGLTVCKNTFFKFIYLSRQLKFTSFCYIIVFIVNTNRIHVLTVYGHYSVETQCHTWILQGILSFKVICDDAANKLCSKSIRYFNESLSHQTSFYSTNAFINQTVKDFYGFISQVGVPSKTVYASW